jgi:hypothetical protein
MSNSNFYKMCDINLGCTDCTGEHGCFFVCWENGTTICVKDRFEAQGWMRYIIHPGDQLYCSEEPTAPAISPDVWTQVSRIGKQ